MRTRPRGGNRAVALNRDAAAGASGENAVRGDSGVRIPFAVGGNHSPMGYSCIGTQRVDAARAVSRGRDAALARDRHVGAIRINAMRAITPGGYSAGARDGNGAVGAARRNPVFAIPDGRNRSAVGESGAGHPDRRAGCFEPALCFDNSGLTGIERLWAGFRHSTGYREAGCRGGTGERTSHDGKDKNPETVEVGAVQKAILITHVRQPPRPRMQICRSRRGRRRSRSCAARRCRCRPLESGSST